MPEENVESNVITLPEPAVPVVPPDPPPPPPVRSLYRVNYYNGGHAYVCAFSIAEALGFLGISAGSQGVTAVASPVEVVGIDAPHPAVAPPPIFVQGPPPASPLTDAEWAKLREILAKG